jgi:hypothetical protein
MEAPIRREAGSRNVFITRSEFEKFRTANLEARAGSLAELSW